MRTFGLLIFALLLAACTPAPSAVTATAAATLTVTVPAPSRTLPSSATPPPTQTPAPPTITPLPTIPAFTPTFDVRRVVTVTPAVLQAICPKEDQTVKIDPKAVRSDSNPSIRNFLASERVKPINNLLNRGFNPSLLVSALKNKHIIANYSDVTGDGVKEVILSDADVFSVFYCDQGRYNLFIVGFGDSNIQTALNLTIIDLNKNGLPEIIISDGPAGNHSGSIHAIYEWKGSDFGQLWFGFQPQWDFGQPKYFEIKDVNQDGLKDFVFTSWLDKERPSDNPDMSPATISQDQNPLLRTTFVVYSWNGIFYAETYLSYATPQYRFQAVQDADRETLYGHYEKALSFYKAVIFNSTLEWASHERIMYLVNTNLAPIYAAQNETVLYVFPTPVPDLTQYPRLAAYASYRMVILYIALGQMDAAQKQYTDLQAKFPVNSLGYPYVEMASHFWAVYQSTGKMYNACAAAIAYADTKPDILQPMYPVYGYDDRQSHTYTPADVCPFR